MELVEQGTASDLLESDATISWQRATRIIADACRGLVAAHAKGLIHRDIKPDNIMLTADRSCATLTTEDLVALSGKSNRAVRVGLLRWARTRLVRGYTADDEAGRRERCRQLLDVTARLATTAGSSQLQFRDARDVEQFVIDNGDWRIDDGRLIGQADGADNFATHRMRFAQLHTVVIRGGIRSTAGLNFRCKVGDVNLLLNWEVRPENHLWRHGQCVAKGPRALTPGREHTIVVFTDGSVSHVCIDGEHWWTAPGGLEGTVTVYPALGSEIFVREILVDGVPDGLTDAPVGVLM
jgi:hypothetical protein